MHLKNIKILDTFNLTGRGKMLVTDLDFDEECYRFAKGDTIRVEDKIYEILAIEALLKMGKTGKIDVVALVAKEITNKELFMKLVSKEKTKWSEKANWRRRNRWWIKPWQKMQLQWYCNIKPLFKKIK